MINSKIAKGLFKYFENSSTGLPAIYWPNLSEDETLPDEYLKLDILSANVTSIGVRTLDKHPGILQIMVNVREGTGEITAKNYADQILSIFPRNTQILEQGIRINVDKTGYISAPLPGDGWYSIAVSIPYYVLN